MGAGNQLPWHLPADMKYFMRTTLGRHVIMGRKTFESMNGKPLPKRTNIVITRDPFYAASGALVVHSLREALALAEANQETEVFIIGGGEIYRESLPLIDKIYLTEIDIEIADGDTFFPDLDPDQWILKSEDVHQPDKRNSHRYAFKVFKKKMN
ncbi:MAG: dihydrofolate reductase [Saprospiraceae bacterium]|nr:dihydrofolate reductase [Saprospiraceae bacterium]